MKKYFTIFFIVLSVAARAQQDTAASDIMPVKHAVYERHSTTATIALGFIDPYRYYYSLPPGFEKSNTSGYSLVYGKIEYGLSKSISIAASFGYDAVFYNFNQLYTGYNGPIRRYKTDDLRIFSGGITGFYHLRRYVHIRNLDPFVGVGAVLNNIRYSALPQGDSTAIKLDHTVTPYLKVGARYYISTKFSLFGDLGYDKQSIFSIGFSCRFFSKKGNG